MQGRQVEVGAIGLALSGPSCRKRHVKALFRIKALFRQLDWSFQARHAARGKHAEHALMYAELRMPSIKAV